MLAPFVRILSRRRCCCRESHPTRPTHYPGCLSGLICSRQEGPMEYFDVRDKRERERERERERDN